MSNDATLGRTDIQVTADTRVADKELANLGKALERAAEAAFGAGDKIDQATRQIGDSAKTQAQYVREAVQQVNAAYASGDRKLQESIRFQKMMTDERRATALGIREESDANQIAIKRAQRAWERELAAGKLRQAQLVQQAAAQMQVARAEQMAALKSEILARAQQEEEAAAIRANMQQIELLREYSAELDAQAARVRAAADAVGGLTAAESAEAEAARASAAAHMEMDGALEAGIPQYAATSAMVRLMEGNMNNMVRAAERFVGQIRWLSTIAMDAFPIIGGIAMTDLLIRMGMKAWDVAEDFITLRETIEAIARAEEDAARAAEHMQDATEASIENILRLTRGETASVKQELTYQQSKGIEMSSWFEGSAWKKLMHPSNSAWSTALSSVGLGQIDIPEAQAKRLESMFKNIAPDDIAAKLMKINALVQEFKSARDYGIHGIGVAVQSVAGFRAPGKYDPTEYWNSMYHAAHTIQEQLQAAADERSAKLQDLQVQIQVDSKNPAMNQPRGSYAANAKAQSDEMQKLKDSAIGLSPSDAYSYWSNRSALFPPGTKEREQITAEVAKAWVAVQRAQVALRAEAAKNNLMFTPFVDMHGNPRAFAPNVDVSRSDLTRSAQVMRALQGPTSQAARMIEAQNKMRAAVQQTNDAIMEQSIRSAAANGDITKLDAAVSIAALHQRQYSEAMAAFAAQIESIRHGVAGMGMTPLEKQTAVANVEAQRAGYQMSASRMLQQDAIATGQWKPGSTMVAVRNALDDFVLAVRDTSGAVRDLVTSALEGTNETLSRALMAHANTGWEYRRNIVNALGGEVRGLGARGLDEVMGHTEGSLLAHFGFGPKAKRGESAASPLFVSVVNGAGGAAGGLGKVAAGLTSMIGSSGPAGAMGGILQGAMKMLPLAFQGFFADGGTVMPGMAAMVGEMGPELFVPHSSGTIIPHHELMRGMGSAGGAGTTHIHIDARHAHDPAAVEMAVHRGMAASLSMTPGIALHTVSDYRKRVPTSKQRA